MSKKLELKIYSKEELSKELDAIRDSWSYKLFWRWWGPLSRLPNEFKHWLKSRYQKLRKGYSDDETWNLDSAFIEWILPRLKRYKELTLGHPHELTEQEWNQKLDTMIHGFELYKQKQYDPGLSAEEMTKVKQAGRVFAKWWPHLWS